MGKEQLLAQAKTGVVDKEDLLELARQGERTALREIAAELGKAGAVGFEHSLAAYEALRGTLPPEDNISLLEKMLPTPWHGGYMLELAALYCSRGLPGLSKARQWSARAARVFSGESWGRDAETLLALLDRRDLVAVEAYRNYAAPAGDFTPVASAPSAAAPASVGAAPAAKVPAVQLPPELSGAFRDLVGLDAVKEQLVRFYDEQAFQRKRQKVLGLEAESGVGHHFILYGNPGTGKTTVARILAQMLCQLGITQSDKLVETDRSGLVSQYIGETAPKTLKLLEEAKGGVLFIDEAYTLYKAGNEKDPGPEAIDTILKYMEDHRAELVVVLAGYRKPMDEMLEKVNPGFRSRFNHHITLPDYTNGELLEIAERTAASKKYVISEAGRAAFLSRMERERLGESFGNARTVRTVMEEAITCLAQRIIREGYHSEAEMMLLLPQDFGIEDANKEDINALLAELDALTGLAGAKEQVRSLVRAAQVRRAEEAQGIHRKSGQTLHMTFLGDPGTGKTTVARLMGRIYRALGLLKRGEVFVECTRSDLVSDHLGGTALKTRELIGRSMGGVLFIDEAYSLYQGENDTFGKEAIDTLIAEMENHRADLVVILAGYTGEMEDFLAANPGMKSRVPHHITFQDYTPGELLDIYRIAVEREGFTLPQGWEEPVERVIAARQGADGRLFANGRGARNLAEATIARRNDRLGELLAAGETLAAGDFTALTAADLPTT